MVWVGLQNWEPDTDEFSVLGAVHGKKRELATHESEHSHGKFFTRTRVACFFCIGTTGLVVQISCCQGGYT
jgi:hypothetical protein